MLKKLPFIEMLKALIQPSIGTLMHHQPRPMRDLPDFRGCDKTKSTCTVSIVTPSLNHANFLINTIDSISDQQYPALEYHIQDGNSEDGTLDLLRSIRAENLSWSSEPDSGQAQAINRAFSKTNGEIMAWVNSDDLLLPGALNCVIYHFNKHPEIDVIYGNRLLIDEDNKEIGSWILPKHNNNVLSWADYIPQETLFWRRSIWDKTGAKLDESFQFAMDWELLIRFRDSGANFLHIDRFLGAFRVHKEQKTSKLLEEIGNQEMNRIRKRCLGYIPTNNRIRKATFIYLARHKLKCIWLTIAGWQR